MKSVTELSPRYAEQKRRIAQRQSDMNAGALLSNVTRNVTVSPVGTSEFYGGALLVFEADDQCLLANGLVETCDLPKTAPGCKSKRRAGNDLIQTYRMPDGRVRLTISAHLVRQRDAGFVDFMAMTVGDALIGAATSKRLD